MKILYFARLREAFGEGEEITLPSAARASEIVALLMGRGGKWEKELSRPFRLAINQKLSSLESMVQDGDEVAIFPPVTGG